MSLVITLGGCSRRTQWSSLLDWTPTYTTFYSGCALSPWSYVLPECSVITWPCHVTLVPTLFISQPYCMSWGFGLNIQMLGKLFFFWGSHNMLLLLSPRFSLFFLQIFLPLCTSLFFSSQIPSLDLDHSLLWMAIFLLPCKFCYYIWTPLFLTNLATAFVYGQWKPSGIVLTPGLFFLSTYLFKGNRLSRVLSRFPTSYSAPSSFPLQTALPYLIWCFLEVHVTSIHDLKTTL